MFWSHIVSISTNSLVCQAPKKIFQVPVNTLTAKASSSDDGPIPAHFEALSPISGPSTTAPPTNPKNQTDPILVTRLQTLWGIYREVCLMR
jgi:hypothetical protein